jgi:hypothetical protein
MVKVLLRTRAGEIESVWCSVVDASKGLFRVANIPMLRVRPMYGDVIVATTNREGRLAFRRTHENCGYWAEVLEYARTSTYRPLSRWLEENYAIISEGVMEPQGDLPGIMAVAIPKRVDFRDVGQAIEARFRGVRPYRERPPPSDANPPARARARPR